MWTRNQFGLNARLVAIRFKSHEFHNIMTDGGSIGNIMANYIHGRLGSHPPPLQKNKLVLH
jgi:phosphoribosylformylglycinamidine (FGAM) synthase-like enzyme